MESHKLYDMKLKHIEEFERVLSKRLKTNPEMTKSSRAHKPSSCLGKALTETLTDYQWEKPDLMSPVKRRKQSTRETSLNFVFLFMKCPKNSKELKMFTGKQVPDEDVFLDSFLSPDLFQQFCTVSKLLLNWIDTQILPTIPANMESCDVTSVRIIEQALSKARGKVFPLDLIVQRGSSFMVNIWNYLESPTRELSSQTSQKECYESIPFLPLSSVLGFLLSTRPGIAGGQARNKNASISVGEEVMDIIMTPVEEGSVRHKMRKDASRMDTVNLSQSSSAALVPYQPSAPTSMSPYALLDVDTARLNIQTDRQYMCTAKIGGSESRFERMISALTRRGCVLVLIDDVTGHLVMLHPLTLQSCSLAPLTKGTSLHVEKLLLSQESDRVNVLEQEAGSPNDLVERLVRNTASVDAGACDMEAVGRFDGRVMDRWYIPGPKTSLNSLLDKLSSRIEHLDFLSADEAEMLQKLRKSYKQQTAPPGLRDTSIVMKTGSEEIAVDDTGGQAVGDTGDPGKTSRGSISRADMILNKSKAVVMERVQTERGDGGKEEKPDRVKLDVAALSAGFKNVEELLSYLTSRYERLVAGETTNIDTAVQTMVAVSLYYMKQASHLDPEGQCKALLEEGVVVSGAKLREKYQDATDATAQECKIAEYQVQVILRLEIQSSLVNGDQSMEEADGNANTEIVSLLRTLSFIMEPGQLSKFMQSCLVFNYMHTIPHTLANIYDELMQPLPESLALLLSPDSSGMDRSVLNSSLIGAELTGGGPPSASTRSHGSVGPPSSQPGSNSGGTQDLSTAKRRKLVHHPSMSDFGAKRQIVVEKVLKQKQAKSTRKRKDSYKRSKDKVTKSLFGVRKGGSKLERRRSVAVMERTARTPSKSRPVPVITSPRTRLQSPRRCKLVAETPSHKQVSQSVRRRMMDLRDQVTDQAEVNNTHVVEESPEKPCKADLKDTPTKDKRAKALLRRSFYSAGPVKRTRNLTQYYQLADRIAGRQRHISGTIADKPARLLSFDAKLKSPSKNSSFLASQLAPSPSPAKLTPRKSVSTVNSRVPSSPSLNTRSKLALFKSPDRLLRSPGRSAITSPRVQRSPFSRRQSLPVFVPDSETKNDYVSPRKTPGKNTVCGKVTFGLDSPSHVTKSKVTSTPTRKSVRAALFASSPRAGRYQSPRRLASSPRRPRVRHESSEKHTAKDENELSTPQNLTSPIHQKTRDSSLNTTPSRRKLKLAETETQTASSHDNCKTKTFTQNSKCLTERTERFPSFDSLQLSQNSDRQRTPSPHGDSVVKTPDSFDKWRRRKPRSAQKSPHHSSSSSDSGENAEINAKVPSSVTSASHHEKLILKSCNRNNVNKSSDFKAARKKRSLISMESLTDSPCKKRKQSEMETPSDFSSVLKHEDSMGFEMTGSFSEMSQQSAASSLDYFSASNEEVFLSQESKSVLWPSDSDEMAENSESRNKFIQSLPHQKFPLKFITAKVSKEDVPLKEDKTSDSPVFGSGKKSSKGRRGVEETAAVPTVRRLAPSGSQASSSSPRMVKSPDGRKYSPVVSVKSMMHLIQSPLVRSPEEGAIIESESPRRRVKHIPATLKTRRSLNLQN